MKQKHLAVALSAIFAAAALTGCGSDNDNNYTPPVVTPPVVTPPVVTPPVTGTEDNVGDAASGIENLNATATVGGQQYKRGATANFDRTLNSNLANTGNETVLNSKTLQNTRLDNIVVGRETVKRLDQDEAILRLAGEAVDGFSDNSSGNTLGLQQHNADGGTETRIKPRFNTNDIVTSPQFATQYYNAQGQLVDGVKFYYNPAIAPGGTGNADVSTTSTDGIPLYAANGQPLTYNTGSASAPVLVPLYLKTDIITTVVGSTGPDAATTGNKIQVNANVNTATTGVRATSTQQEAGLVTIDTVTATPTNNAGYTVKGQEDTTGLRANVSVDGSTKTTRIFGNKYRDVTNNAATNSYRFTNNLNAANEYATDPSLGLQAIKLNNVQYGRVTSNIDKLDNIFTAGRDGTTYYQSEISNAGTRVPNGTPGQVDTYFYRGTGETSVADMKSFFANQGNIDKGTVSYAGHAVMYGIDNTYHGNRGNPDTNAPGNGEIAKNGVGNLVQANVDIATKKITGSVFNVWTLNNGAKDIYRKDDLVTFKGNINGNTAKGESQLAYGSKDTGAFKGSFFGTQAQEFGGSLNSIDDGLYGKAAWGGVFGTQKVTQVIVDGNANQTE